MTVSTSHTDMVERARLGRTFCLVCGDRLGEELRHLPDREGYETVPLPEWAHLWLYGRRRAS